MASTFTIKQEEKENRTLVINSQLGEPNDRGIGFILNGKDQGYIYNGETVEVIIDDLLSNIINVEIYIPRELIGSLDFWYSYFPNDTEYKHDWDIPTELQIDYINIATNNNEIFLNVGNKFGNMERLFFNILTTIKFEAKTFDYTYTTNITIYEVN